RNAFRAPSVHWKACHELRANMRRWCLPLQPRISLCRYAAELLRSFVQRLLHYVKSFQYLLQAPFKPTLAMQGFRGLRFAPENAWMQPGCSTERRLYRCDESFVIRPQDAAAFARCGISGSCRWPLKSEHCASGCGSGRTTPERRHGNSHTGISIAKKIRPLSLPKGNTRPDPLWAT